MSSQTLYSELRSQLDHLKSNEHLYHTKLKQINLSRQQIAYQLEQLQTSYDRKIKLLEQKVQKYQQENEQLVRQNVLFRSEIEHFQTRLVEKEKIIGILINQKGELNGINSSDRSKSDKTESNKDTKQDKIFKKSRDSQQQLVMNAMLKNKVQEYKDKQAQQSEEISRDAIKIESAPKITPPPPPAKNTKKKAETSMFQHSLVYNYQQQQQQLTREPSNPADVFTNLQSHPKQQQELTQNLQQEPQNPSQVFAHLEQQQASPQLETPQAPPQKKKAPVPPPARSKPKKKPNKPAIKAPVSTLHNAFEDQVEQSQQHNSQVLSYFSNSAHNLQETSVPPSNSPNFDQPEDQDDLGTFNPSQPTQAMTPAYQQYYGHPDPQNIEENIQQYNYPSHHQNQDRNDREFMTEKKAQDEEDNSNFLAHFNNSQQLETVNVEWNKPKPHKKKTAKRPPIKSLESYPSQTAFDEEEPNPNSVFEQMSKNQEHELNIEESSIDHIDRDSSYVSNQHNYFNDEPDEPIQTVRPKPPVKMTKKKAKRGQISAVNPTMFE